ncbi:hypothetical protein [Cryobacterium zhongshanensis]|uniref:Uncharacterized protein n=1 Tax=Cryobacterium zhongshanensis TaxID=2928153 RepID=A0AA41ULM1_9MICO|nr:hypothetical protein [Cryobacterium zhongshanensis]MCI4659031.1 hypothetical protein [Cryobacterium zhongshanensis]
MTTDTTSPADEGPVSVKTEYLPDDAIAVLGDRDATPSVVLRAIVGTIVQTAPDALIVITGDFIQSVRTTSTLEASRSPRGRNEEPTL